MQKALVLWMLVGLSISACCHPGPQESLKSVTAGNNQFSSQLYDVVSKTVKDNLILSPISVSNVLAMIQNGAQGKSAEGLRQNLHFPPNYQLNEGYQVLLEQLKSDENVTLEMANRIYPAKGYKLNSQFVQNLQKFYNAEPQQLDFASDADGSATAINKFVSNVTNDRIKDLIVPSDLDGQTKLVLVNGIYFKGTWKYQFPKKDTQKMPFYTGESNKVNVDMMKLEGDLYYADVPELDAQVVCLPYKGDRLRMVIILPHNRTGLVSVEDKLKTLPLEKVIESLKLREIQLFLPKFKVESKIDLKEPLIQLGASSIFSPDEANLSGILHESNKERLYVSRAIQKAFIEVNEEGSEAAAASAADVTNYSIRTKPTVYVGHPFLFEIIQVSNTTGVEAGNVNNSTNENLSVLFTGKVSRIAE